MICEIFEPANKNNSRVYFKCIETKNQDAQDNAFALWDMLNDTFMRYTPNIVCANGYDNGVSMSKTPAPYLK